MSTFDVPDWLKDRNTGLAIRYVKQWDIDVDQKPLTWFDVPIDQEWWLDTEPFNIQGCYVVNPPFRGNDQTVPLMGEP